MLHSHLMNAEALRREVMLQRVYGAEPCILLTTGLLQGQLPVPAPARCASGRALRCL